MKLWIALVLTLFSFYSWSSPQIDQKGLEKVIETLRKELPIELSESEMYQAAIKGVLAEVDKRLYPHKGQELGAFETNVNSLMSKELMEQLHQEVKGEISGIGVVIKAPEGQDPWPHVIETISGSSAEKAGLQKGDLILSVDGRSTKGLDFMELVQKIRGPEGSWLKLSVLRDGKVLAEKVRRTKIQVPTFESKIFEDQKGLIKLSSFHEQTPQLLAQALKEFEQKKIKGAIIDLRGNAGGSFQAVQESLGHLIKKGEPLFVLEKANKQKEVIVSQGPEKGTGIHWVVLIDQETRSAAEAFAYVMKQAKGAKLVGEKTFGKATVEKLVQLENGPGLKYTVAKIQGLKGENWLDEGLAPDLHIPTDKGTHKENKKDDHVIKLAKEIL